MHERLISQRLSDLLVQFPAVALLGPRQTGKTTLAFAQKDIHPNALYLDLELPSAQRQLDDPEAFFMAHPNQLVILDEVQRLPGVFSILRGVIDQRRRNGEATRQFLLLGNWLRVLIDETVRICCRWVARRICACECCLVATRRAQVGGFRHAQTREIPANLARCRLHVDSINTGFSYGRNVAG